MKTIRISVVFAMMTGVAMGDAVVLPGVPSYVNVNNNGCAGTAAAMAFGYYAINGYSKLFDAQGSAIYLTSNVQYQIMSLAHHAKYDGTDNPNLPTPPLTSFADFLGTSVGSLADGSTNISSCVPGITNYATYRGYAFTANTKSYSSTWATLESEINASRPMIFFVDLTYKGAYDHVVTAIGYDNNHNGDGPYYACYNTAHEDEATVDWYKFLSAGVYGSIQIVPVSLPDPDVKVVTSGAIDTVSWNTQTGAVTVLQKSPSLTAWTTVTQTPTIVGLQTQVVVPKAGTKMFYRLVITH